MIQPEPPLHLRNAAAGDADAILAWRNDTLARKMSSSQEVVSPQNHNQWFTARLANPDCRMYVGVSEAGRRVGVIRFDRVSADTAEVSINVAPAGRGRGLGRRLLALGIDRYLFDHPRIETLVATIREDNSPSEHIFTLVGFADRRGADHRGFFTLIYSRGDAIDMSSSATGR